MTGKILKRMIDGVKVAVVAVDQNLRAEYANAAFRALFSTEAEKGSLGKLTACAECARTCNKREGCRGCGLAAAFEDAFLSNREVSRRIYQRVRSGGTVHEVTYTLTATPIGETAPEITPSEIFVSHILTLCRMPCWKVTNRTRSFSPCCSITTRKSGS